MAACLCTVTLVAGLVGRSSLMTRARHVHVPSSPSTVLNAQESMAQVVLLTGEDTAMSVVGYHIEIRKTIDGFASTSAGPGPGV